MYHAVDWFAMARLDALGSRLAPDGDAGTLYPS